MCGNLNDCTTRGSVDIIDELLVVRQWYDGIAKVDKVLLARGGKMRRCDYVNAAAMFELLFLTSELGCQSMVISAGIMAWLGIGECH